MLIGHIERCHGSETSTQTFLQGAKTASKSIREVTVFVTTNQSVSSTSSAAHLIQTYLRADSYSVIANGGTTRSRPGSNPSMANSINARIQGTQPPQHDST